MGKDPTGKQRGVWREEFGEQGWKTLTSIKDMADVFGGRFKMMSSSFPEFLEQLC